MSSAAAPNSSPDPRRANSSSSVDDRLSITLEPDPSGWIRALEHVSITDEQRRARAALGLPTDRPIVMSGHQAGFWHAGILTKHLAADALAQATGATHGWIIVDQDTASPSTLRWPESEDGRLIERTIDLAGADEPETPAGLRRPLSRAIAPPSPFAGLADALDSAPSSACQVAKANARLIRDRVGAASPSFVNATSLVASGILDSLINRMLADPEACLVPYNSAVAAHPAAGMRPLITRPSTGRFELPLWHIAPGAPRQPVMASEASQIAPDHLAPRALLMTAALRLFACDLFIHGTGGGIYDRITESWIEGWLGTHPGARLAPTAVATATLSLDPSRLGGTAPPRDRDVAFARWRAHTGRHRPGVLGDEDMERTRAELVASIEAAPRLSPERRSLYRALHAFESDYRASREEEIRALDSEVDRLQAARADATLAYDRTWPWMLHTDDDLRTLRDRINSAFGVTR